MYKKCYNFFFIYLLYNSTMNIFSLMTPKSLTFYLSTKFTLRQAIEKMEYHKYSVIPVIDEDGKFVESISEGDILRFFKTNNGIIDLSETEKIEVNQIEKFKPYKALRVDAEFDEMVELSLVQNFIPIIDDRGIFIGIVRRSAIIKELKRIAMGDEDGKSKEE